MPLPRAIELVGAENLRKAAGSAYRGWQQRKKAPAGHVLALLLEQTEHPDSGEVADLIAEMRQWARRTGQRGQSWRILVNSVRVGFTAASVIASDNSATASG